MNIPYYLEMYSRKFANKTFLKTEDNQYSYAQMNELSNRLASSLKENAITRGDKIILFLPNGFDFVVSYFATLKIGAIVVPINTKLTASEIQMIYEDCGANAIIAAETLAPEVDKTAFSGLKISTGTVENWLTLPDMLEHESTKIETCTTNEETISTILYTSGTTGKPKGVMLSNRNILAVGQMICIEMKMTEDTISLLMMPLSHSAPLHLFFISTLLVGGTVVTRKDFHPLELLKTVEQEKTTHFFGAPVAYLLAAKLLEQHAFNLSSMEWWVYGGAPVDTKEIQYIQKQFNTHRLTGVYGLTEAGPSGSLLFPAQHTEKAGSIGKRASLFTELKIVDDHGKDVAPNEVGEILIKGLGVMSGYYNQPEKTAETLQDGWIRTGDLGKYDEDGYLWIVDRAKDLIITGGINVYPFEIEKKMLQFPSIAEVAVVGVPHPEWGETVKAFYVSETEIDEAALKTFLNEHLATHKVPRIYEKVAALPRNPTGKILKHLLREKAD